MPRATIRVNDGLAKSATPAGRTILRNEGSNQKLAPANTVNLEISRRDFDIQNNGVSGISPATAQGVLQPNISGMIASYDATTFANNVWSDNTGSYDTDASRGTVSISSTQLNGHDILEGATTDGLRFPTGVLPSTFTLFHLTRYNGTEARIFQGITANWLDGFWSGRAGVAYHDGWITPQTDYHTTNWVLSTSQNSLYRSNGVTRGTSGGSSSKQLGLNYGHYTAEYSAWQCAEVIVFNRHLTSAEYTKVEQYLSFKYGIAVGGSVATSWPYPGTFGALQGNRDTGIRSVLSSYSGSSVPMNHVSKRTPIVVSKPSRQEIILANQVRARIKTTGQVNTRLQDTVAVQLAASGGGGGGGGGGSSDSAVASTIKQIWY